MIYLLDSNAIRDLMDDHPRVVARLSATKAPDAVATCGIVRGEVLFGIERLAAGKRRDRLAVRAAAVFARLVHEAVPFAAGDAYARVKRERQRAGLPMDENDLWIAATAVVLSAAVVSRDADFRNVTGLAVEDWTA